MRLRATIVVCCLIIVTPLCAAPWARHTIDNSSRGADGVRPGDVNGDGRLDIVTGWEEGGLIRLYLQPERDRLKAPWPAVTVGRVASPEDAVMIHLNGDGVLDVASSCEGKTRTVFAHLAPSEPSELLDEGAWTTKPIPATQKQEQWMYALPWEKDGRLGGGLILGSKGQNASVSRLDALLETTLGDAKLERLRDAGWIMSLEAIDIDRDGDLDVLASDRKGDQRGVFWLENGDKTDGANRREHPIGGGQHEVMFLDHTDLDGDGRLEIIVAAKPKRVLVFSRPHDVHQPWPMKIVELSGPIGNAKTVRAGDVNLDGKMDLVVTCEGAAGTKSGAAWFERDTISGQWSFHDIAGAPGEKYDRIELLDLDADGDLDVITCEERDNLGVIWYENPTRQ